MPASETASNASTETARSRRGVLHWTEIEEGMLGRADHSVKHAIVTALTSVITALPADSVLKRDLDALPELRGKYRPFIVVEKPRGYKQPGRIVLTTHFGGRPVAQLDACARALAVSLGAVTPPWPNADSPRITFEPAWDEPNNYAVAYEIDLLRERAPTRYRKAGKEYRVDRAELRKLRGLCRERAVLLATMSQTALHAMRTSYEAFSSQYSTVGAPPSRKGSKYGGGRSRVSAAPSLPAIRENVRAPEPAPPPAPKPVPDAEGFIKYVKRSSRRGSQTGSFPVYILA